MVPAGKVFWKISKFLVVLSEFVRCVPVSTQVASIQGRLPVRGSIAIATGTDWLTVNVTSGLAVDDLESFAVRIHRAPATPDGTAVSVNVRSPYWVTPVRRLDCTDQSAALALSATLRLVIVSPPPPP